LLPDDKDLTVYEATPKEKSLPNKRKKSVVSPYAMINVKSSNQSESIVTEGSERKDNIKKRRLPLLRKRKLRKMKTKKTSRTNKAILLRKKRKKLNKPKLLLSNQLILPQQKILIYMKILN